MMETTLELETMSRFGRTFRALHGRDYRLWYAGQGVSLLGTFLQQTALAWYLYRTTGSAAVLGQAAMASQIPTLLAVPLAGVLADRIPRRAALMTTQFLMALQSAVLAFVISSGNATVPTILLLSGFLGLVMGFDIPIRQAFMSQVIHDRLELPNALTLNSALFNFARLAGPALGGFAVAAWGEGNCLWANAASFLAVLAAIWAIRADPPQPREEGLGMRQEFEEVIRRATTDPVIRSALLLVAATSFGALAVMPLFPAAVRELVHGGPRELGFLMSAAGFGALVSALHLAGKVDLSGWRRTAPRSLALAGTGILLLAFTPWSWCAYLGAGMAGFGSIEVTTGANALLQSRVEERMRGRIVSLFVLSFAGLSPFGSLALGHLAAAAGIRMALGAAATFCLLVAALFALRSLAGSRGQPSE